VKEMRSHSCLGKQLMRHERRLTLRPNALRNLDLAASCRTSSFSLARSLTPCACIGSFSKFLCRSYLCQSPANPRSVADPLSPCASSSRMLQHLNAAAYNADLACITLL
jgi:hypothetical protein